MSDDTELDFCEMVTLASTLRKPLSYMALTRLADEAPGRWELLVDLAPSAHCVDWIVEQYTLAAPLPDHLVLSIETRRDQLLAQQPESDIDLSG